MLNFGASKPGVKGGLDPQGTLDLLVHNMYNCGERDSLMCRNTLMAVMFTGFVTEKAPFSHDSKSHKSVFLPCLNI